MHLCRYLVQRVPRANLLACLLILVPGALLAQSPAPPGIDPQTSSAEVAAGPIDPRPDGASADPRGSCAAAQAGDIEENEPDNCGIHPGGCDFDPPSFDTIRCGDSVHGLSGTFISDGLSYRDTDWWLFEVTGSGTICTWTVTADFPVLIGFVTMPCPPAFIPRTARTSPSCVGVASSTACLPPGQYLAFVAPSTFSGVPCDSEYRGTLVCTPCQPPAPPVNDGCESAPLVRCGETVQGTNVNATSDGVWTCAPGGSDVWYRYTAASSSLTISLCGSTFDTAVMVVDGCGGPVVGCNDDACGLQSTLTVSGLAIGESYLIAVSGFSGQQGEFTMSLSGQCCTGDLDHDGTRGLEDLSLLLGQFGSLGSELSGDLDSDGDVDIQDLATLLSVFGTPC